MHKLRNVADKLPDDLAATVTKKMRAAYHAPRRSSPKPNSKRWQGNWSTPTPARRAAFAKA
jgi:transposase-like protein